MAKTRRKPPNHRVTLWCLVIGADGGTRTHTMLPPGDFESPASTIPPHRHGLRRNAPLQGRQRSFVIKVALQKMYRIAPCHHCHTQSQTSAAAVARFHA